MIGTVSLPIVCGSRNGIIKVWMKKCAEIALEQAEEILAEIEWKQYDDVVMVGKSVGTVVSALYAQNHGIRCRFVLLTPLEETFDYISSDSIAFHGTADPWARTEIIKERCEKQGIPLFLTDGANHSLETGDVEKDLEMLQEVIKTVKKFVKKGGKPQ